MERERIVELSSKDRTEEENKELQEAVKAFSDEVSEVCGKHNMTHKAVIETSKEGIVPALVIVGLAPEKPEEKS